MKANVFLNFHPEAFDTGGKRARQQAGNAQAFADPGELSRQLERATTAFRQELARQRR